MKPRQITLFGNFGRQNLGNECTLQAIIYGARKRVPDAKLQCLCTVPEDTVARHNIAAFPSTAAWPQWVTARLKRYRSRRGRGVQAESRRRAPLAKWFRIVLVRLPKELLHWTNGWRKVRGSQMLIVPGTGLVSDHVCGPFGWPYDIFKWSTIARLCRARLFFVAIGVGPIHHPLSRWFVKTSLRLADYRSYRDTASKRYVEGIGFRATRDRVCPDLAFGLPRSVFPECPLRTGQKPVIGVGLKDYAGPCAVGDRPDPRAYHNYLNTMASFVAWLCEEGYAVRVLIGDVSYDSGVRQDLLNVLQERGVAPGNGTLTVQPVLTVDELMHELAATDLVISPRLHNLVLALMLGKPVIALSDHQKLNSLMAGLELDEYCVPLSNLDVDTLVKQLRRLECDAPTLKPRIEQKVEEYREALDQEYSAVFPEERAFCAAQE